MSDPVQSLARLRGIGDAYHDYRGSLWHFSDDTKRALLAAMGFTDERALNIAIDEHESARWQHMLPPVLVCPTDQASVTTTVASDLTAAELHWRVRLEDGNERSGWQRLEHLEVIETGDFAGRAFKRLRWRLPEDLPDGYHHLRVSLGEGLTAETLLVLAPRNCYAPRVIESGTRVWGLSLQLYSLRSPHNWGIGDFRDLKELIVAAAPLGCAVVGLNPLHALFPADPAHISPYSPSSRQFLNVLYIAVPEVPDFEECAAAQKHVGSTEFQTRLAELRQVTNVDYPGVAAAKLDVLRLLHSHFHTAHIQQRTARGLVFERYVADRGRPLQLHALYDVLDAHFRGQGSQYWGWPSWPTEFQTPHTAAVQQFAAEHAVEVEFFLYLQWLAEEQLYIAQRAARESGMTIGLYGDVAVGANASGSETWANCELYLPSASIGAPPDPLALKGQDWGIPPQDPTRLRLQKYAPFTFMLGNNMRPMAALRIDHVMSLFRLWWVPRGVLPTEGAYVHYPLHDLMFLLALESHRNHCMVIGEDLGTVPDEVRAAMEHHAVYHYKVLLFEKEHDGRFKSPSAYTRHALATVTTHDLPTLRGWWQGLDLGLRDKLGLYPNDSIRAEVHAGRDLDRRQLLQALVGQDLWRWHEHEPLPEYSLSLSRAIHLFLARSQANLVLVQPEDLIGMADPVNVPGTNTEHPNWQRKMPLAAGDIFAAPEVVEMLQAIHRARQAASANGG
jgi:4-alpha-glucanotransferase